jgi:hypothetical protein
MPVYSWFQIVDTHPTTAPAVNRDSRDDQYAHFCSMDDGARDAEIVATKSKSSKNAPRTMDASRTGLGCFIFGGEGHKKPAATFLPSGHVFINFGHSVPTSTILPSGGKSVFRGRAAT